MTGTDLTETGTDAGDEAPTTAPERDAAPWEAGISTREYVEERRDEAAGHRVEAERADAPAARLVTAHATSTGKLADPTDLPFTADVPDDDGLVGGTKVQAVVQAAVDDPIERKPRLAARRPTGDVGQGAAGDSWDGARRVAAPRRLARHTALPA